MRYLAQLITQDDKKILIPLKCREYHAAKLQYVLSRTLDRSCFKDARVLAVDSVGVDDINAVVIVQNDEFDLRLIGREVGNA